jgi:phosphoribosyl-dephospho-CoA transferase
MRVPMTPPMPTTMPGAALPADAVLSAHDLIWLVDPAGFARDTVLPAWAGAAWLARAPWVVRRASRADAGRIPAGLRGVTRAQREALWLPRTQIQRVVTPAMIARQERWHGRPLRASLPVLHTLASIAPQLNALQLDWGITGGVGFALASGLDVLHEGSDLDLQIQSPTPLPASVIHALGTVLDGQRARVDVQVETPLGGFALRERLRTNGRVLLKTDDGPVLTANPWGDAGTRS